MRVTICPSDSPEEVSVHEIEVFTLEDVIQILSGILVCVKVIRG